AGETRRVVYLHEEKPKVSIIVPTRNRLDLLGPCVESLVKKTAWPDWELLIVDNDSDDPAILAYFDKLRELLPERVKIISVPEDFDFSAMNNRAARQARGDYLLLLNNDTECLHGEWLDAMMSYAQRPDVGIVGARLLFPENLQLQHAGMILGADGNGTAGHVFFLQPHDVPGYMNRALLDQEYSAVTGACLLIRASIYHQVAGLDPLFKIQHQDVDLCLKVVELGYRVIWTPFATLIHRSSASLRHSVVDKKVMDSIGEETENFISRWKHRLFRDPAWNRHLGFDFPQYQDRKPTLEMELAVPWNPDFHDRPRVLFLPGRAPVSGDYRGGAALRALNAGGRLHHAAAGRPNADGSRRVIKPVELDRLAPDTLFIHLPVDDASLNALLRYQKHNPEISLICSIDEHPGSPSDEIRLQIALSVSRRLIVGTGPLKEAFREMIGDIRVVPDALERRIWDGLSLEHEQKRKPRVGWTCGQAGAGDSHLMREIVKATHREVDWVFLGALPDELLSELRPCLAERHEFHEYPPDFETWPQKLASLNLDLALAPLEIHPVNEAKSNRRLLEYGMLGWPVVCTDILPYQTGNPPALRLPNDPDKWIAAIRERVGEPDALAREGKALREWVEKNHLLESTLDLWLDALCQTGTNPVMDLRKP
ncbi:MAG: glycosyltransferase, partial [Candidatus Accumulibacter sp.]|nr:glycosyltransferase [Accumulibacter sp.]